MISVGRRRVLAVLGSAVVAGCPGMSSSDDPEELTWTVEDGPATATAQADGSQSEGWPMAAYDAGATGTAPAGHAPSSFPLEERWSYTSHLAHADTPIVHDGTVLSVAGDTITALDATSGDERWQETDENDVRAIPAVRDGTAVLSQSYAESDAHLEAVDLDDGSRRWRATTTDGTEADPVVTGETVYAAQRTTLTARGLATGERCTRIQLSGTIWTITGLAVADGTAYLTTEGSTTDQPDTGYVVAFDPRQGTVDWTYRTDTGIRDIAVVDGTVYFVAADRLHALAADSGEEDWRVDAGEYLDAVTADADEVVVTGDGVTAYGTDGGDEQWRRTDVGTSAVVRAGETVFAVGGTQYELHALSAADGRTRWRENLIWVATGAAVADGTLFVGNDEGAVHAYA